MILRRRFLLYMPVLVGASALMFVKTFVYARLFTVDSFGLLSQALLVASTFTNFAGAGLQLLGHKALPQYHARGDRESFDNLLASAIAICAVSGVLAVAAVGIAAASGSLNRGATFAVAIVYAVAQYLFVLRLIEIKSELRFLDHSLLSITRAAAVLALGVVVALATRDITVTLAMESIVTLLLAAPLVSGTRGQDVLRRALALPTEHRWLGANFGGALRLLWLQGTYTILYATDRWSGIALLTKHEYGIFALGLSIVALFETLQVIVNVSAYPLMGRMIAEGEHRRAFRFATLATVLVVVGGALCYMPFALFLDFLLHKYLPAYAEAAKVIKLAVAAGILRLADFYASYAVLRDSETRLALASGALVLLTVAGISAAHTLGGVRFDPSRMIWVSVGVAVCGFLLNLAIATNAWLRWEPGELADSRA
jgi:O-antigen/teichoic acid export membrane protein